MRNELPVIRKRLSRLSLPDMERIAEKAQVGRVSVWRVSNGYTPNPGYLTVLRIARAMRSLGL